MFSCALTLPTFGNASSNAETFILPKTSLVSASLSTCLRLVPPRFSRSLSSARARRAAAAFSNAAARCSSVNWGRATIPPYRSATDFDLCLSWPGSPASGDDRTHASRRNLTRPPAGSYKVAAYGLVNVSDGAVCADPASAGSTIGGRRPSSPLYCLYLAFCPAGQYRQPTG